MGKAPKKAAMVSVTDTLENVVTGMGTARDKSTSTIFALRTFDRQQMNAAYKNDWILRKAVDIPAYDATREWRSWQADPNDIAKLEEVERALLIQRKLKTAMQRARLYGGAALIMGVAVGEPDQELLPEQVKKDSLKYVHVATRHEITASEINRDLNSPYFGEPEYYTRQNTALGTQIRIHPSRVVRLVGMETPDIEQAQGWGDSLLEVIADAVLAAGTSIQSIAQLISETKLDIISIPGLAERAIKKEYADKMAKRMSLAATAKSLYKILVIDKDEEWHRIEQNFTGLNDLLKSYLLVVCAAADIPATRFLSQSPTGLSATGESDLRNYYDRIASELKTDVSPVLKRFDDVMMMSALGAKPDDVFYNWNPLWQLDEKAKAEIAKIKAEVMTADFHAGLIDPVVLKKARENQLIEDGTYPGLEGFIEEFDLDQEGDGLRNEPEPDPDDSIDPNAPDDGPGDENEGGTPAKRPAAASKRGNRRGNDAAKGQRTATADTRPRTLYVRRDVINADEIVAWAKGQGFKTTLPADDMHVTVAFSRRAVDWMKVGAAWPMGNENGNLIVPPGGPRQVEQFNGGAVVLAFSNTDLQWRHRDIIEAGASFDFDEYTPHVTITFKKPDSLDIDTITPYRGRIVLGPEIFEELNEDWKSSVVEDRRKPKKRSRKPT